MKRRLLNLLTALSLLLCVAVCFLWVRSYWVSEGVAWLVADDGVGQRGYSFSSDIGVLQIYSSHVRDHRSEQSLGFFWNRLAPDFNSRPLANTPDPGYQRFGRRDGLLAFGAESLSRPQLRIWRVTVPHWFPALAFALLPAARLALWRRHHRRRRSAARGFPVNAAEPTA